MNGDRDKAAAWVYSGIWRVLSDWFRVPRTPPTLPAREGDFIVSFHPSLRYLGYLKLFFWIVLIIFDVVILLGWLAVWIASPRLALLLAVPAIVVGVVPDILAYVAIHLRYDTMWYVMTDRSLRCRRGILVILEHTITFENVQNVHVSRGPIQYFFGISTIVVETAGASEGEGQNEFAVGNKTILEGIDNPDEIRTLITDRVRRTKSAGLDDEHAPDRPSWQPEHLGLLEQILAEVRALDS